MYSTSTGELRNRAPGWTLWTAVRDRLASRAGQLPSDVQRSLLNLRMKDVAIYLSNGSLACAVDNRFERTMDSAAGDGLSRDARRPVIVVAHSLGSMIVYKNLINRPTKTPVYLVTIGSMIGDAGVQRSLLGSAAAYPAPVPLPVAWWRNLVNNGDLLAFKASPAFTSSEPSKRPVDDLLDLQNEDRHSAAGYLGSPNFARRLNEALCLASGQPAGCAE